MLDIPVPMKELVLAPAERADVLVDFSRFAGQTLVMKNHRPPKPVVDPGPVAGAGHADPRRHDGLPAGPDLDPVEPARAAPPTCADPVTTRYITLNEIDTDEADWFLNLNGVRFDEDVDRDAEGRARWRTGSTSTSPGTRTRCTCTWSRSR